MITLTESAANRFKEQLQNRGYGLGINLSVKKTGCSGYAYVLNFHDTPDTNNYIVYKSNDVKIFVENESLKYVDGTQIDYVKNGLNEAFKFINPQVKGECGCGESFTI
jgi:iron-sulfur cluster assembly protein